MEDQEKRDWLLLAALLLNRNEPMASHHVAAVRERLGYATDAQLLESMQKGVPPNVAGNRLASQGQSELTGVLGGPARSEKD